MCSLVPGDASTIFEQGLLGYASGCLGSSHGAVAVDTGVPVQQAALFHGPVQPTKVARGRRGVAGREQLLFEGTRQSHEKWDERVVNAEKELREALPLVRLGPAALLCSTQKCSDSLPELVLENGHGSDTHSDND